jgi:hypothetical protein
MPKVAVSAPQRVREFPNEGLVSENGKLSCKFCSTNLDYEKKSTVSDHCKGSRHQKMKSKNLLN